MSGFTLYETLRILVPGLLALGLGDLVVRLAVGTSPLRADGGVRGLTDVLESPFTGIAIALALGLVLYLVDLSARTRLQAEGDLRNRKRIPSTTLAAYLEGTPMASKSLGLYFILSDRYLPLELHKRVYLFGSLYRIYVDLRALLCISVIGGIATALVSASSKTTFDPSPAWSTEMAVLVGTILGAVLLVGGVGQQVYRQRIIDAFDRDEYRTRLRADLREIARLAAVLLVAGVAAGTLLLSANVGLRIVGGLITLMEILVWTWVEIGPPEGTREGLLGSRVLGYLAPRTDHVQYGPAQRLTADISLFAPWLAFSTLAHAARPAQIASVAAWGLLALLSTTIMSFRKHEERLVQIYEDQSTWLDLHAESLMLLRNQGKLPDVWD